MPKTSRSTSKSIVTTKSLQFFKKYINNASPVGFETSGQRLWLDYIRPYVNSSFTDPYGTAVGIINPDAPFKVVIEAHADEISWFVNYVNPEGLMYLKRNGGVDHQIAPRAARLHPWKKGTGDGSLWLAGDSYQDQQSGSKRTRAQARQPLPRLRREEQERN